MCVSSACARGGGGACVFGSAGHLEGGPDGLAAGDAAEQAALEDQEERLDVPGGPLGDARKRRQGRGRHGWAESNNHKGGMGWGGVGWGVQCVWGGGNIRRLSPLWYLARMHARIRAGCTRASEHALTHSRTSAHSHKCAQAHAHGARGLFLSQHTH